MKAQDNDEKLWTYNTRDLHSASLARSILPVPNIRISLVSQLSVIYTNSNVYLVLETFELVVAYNKSRTGELATGFGNN